VKTLTMLGAAVVAAGLVPHAALAAPATAIPAPPAPEAAPAPPAPPAPGAVPAPPSEEYSGTDEAIRRARAASSAAAAAAAEAGKAAGEAGRAAGEAGRVEAQLETARHRLAADAAEVARLSMQVSKPLMERFQMRFEGSPHALIGVELSGENRSDGARVVHVSPGGPAFEAGIRPGDVIVSVNGTDAKGEGGVNRIVRAIHEATPNQKLSIRVMHQGKSKDLVVTAREMPNVVYSMADANGLPLLPGPPANSPVFTYHELGIPSLSNMQLMTLSPGLGRYFGTDKGVLVVRAPTRSDFKLQDGDVILSIDGREPTSGAHATRILASYQAGEKVTLHIMRDRKPLNLETTLPEQKWSYGEFQAPRPTGPNE
jgi:C-terminal processing protease CtpA/Prc